MFYEEVFSALQENNVRYVVAGGLAVILHGIVRFTADIESLKELMRRTKNDQKG